MSLIMEEGYASLHPVVNDRLHSTANDALPHNFGMELKAWINKQMELLGVNPTGLLRELVSVVGEDRAGEFIGQSQMSRILGKQDPTWKTLTKIKNTFDVVRASRGMPPADPMPLMGEGSTIVVSESLVQKDVTGDKRERIISILAKLRELDIDSPAFSAVEGALGLSPDRGIRYESSNGTVSSSAPRGKSHSERFANPRKRKTRNIEIDNK